MGKSHRGNARARKKRGPAAFEKRAKRRAPDGRRKCAICGTRTRVSKLNDQGVCPKCVENFL